jgi:glycine C-acetyltransferase
VVDQVDLISGTLGKALGGASGGYVSGRKPLIELLRQRSRPCLFSNSVAPVGAGRIRAEVSAAHEPEDLRFAIEAFADVKRDLAL